MKYSIPRQSNHNLESDGIVFFAQRLEEMLADSAVDLYKMPLLNTHSLASEYCKVSEDVTSGLLKEHYRTAVYEEFISSFKNDIVLSLLITRSKGFNYTFDIILAPIFLKNNIIAYIDATLDNGKYLNWTKDTILKYTNLPKEKSKIEALLRCFLPELIMWGYDPEFIAVTLNTHFFRGAIISNDTVKSFLDVFDLKVHEYKVYFSVSTISQNFKTILEKRLHVHFEDDGNFNSFKHDRNKIVIYFDGIRARCPNTAAKRAYSYLDMFFSFYKYVGNKRSLPLQNSAMVIEKNARPVFVGAKKQSFAIIEDINYTEIGEQSDFLITGLLNNAENEYSMLSKAIELHNTALAVSDLKSGFLNLWSAMEILSQEQGADSKLGPVLALVIPILKKEYISTQIRELNKAIKDNLSPEDYQRIYEQIAIEGCETKKTFYLIYLDKYATIRNELFEKLSAVPLLRSRIHLLSSASTTKKLNTMITAYSQRITWHMYRMYRTRNAIVHSGDVPNNLKYLGEHLHSYLDSTTNEFAVKLSGEIPFSSREDIITDLKFALSRLESFLEKDIPINEEVINVLLHPEISYTMNCEKHTQL